MTSHENETPDLIRELEEHAADLAASTGSSDKLPDLGPENAEDYATNVLLDLALQGLRTAKKLEAEARTLASLFEAYGIGSSGSVDIGFMEFLYRLGYDDPDSIASLCEYTNALVGLEDTPTTKATIDDVVRVARMKEAAELNQESTNATKPYFINLGVDEEQLEQWITYGTSSRKKLIRRVARHLPGFPQLEKRLKHESELGALELEYVISRTLEARDELDKQIEAINGGDEEAIRAAWRALMRNPRARELIGKMARREEIIVDAISEEDLPGALDE